MKALDEVPDGEGGEAGGAVVDVKGGVTFDDVQRGDGWISAGTPGGAKPKVDGESGDAGGTDAGSGYFIDSVEVEGDHGGGLGAADEAIDFPARCPGPKDGGAAPLLNVFDVGSGAGVGLQPQDGVAYATLARVL